MCKFVNIKIQRIYQASNKAESDSDDDEPLVKKKTKSPAKVRYHNIREESSSCSFIVSFNPQRRETIVIRQT